LDGSNPSACNCAISDAWLSDKNAVIAGTFLMRAAVSSLSDSRASALPMQLSHKLPQHQEVLFRA